MDIDSWKALLYLFVKCQHLFNIPAAGAWDTDTIPSSRGEGMTSADVRIGIAGAAALVGSSARMPRDTPVASTGMPPCRAGTAGWLLAWALPPGYGLPGYWLPGSVACRLTDSTMLTRLSRAKTASAPLNAIRRCAVTGVARSRRTAYDAPAACRRAAHRVAPFSP